VQCDLLSRGDFIVPRTKAAQHGAADQFAPRTWMCSWPSCSTGRSRSHRTTPAGSTCPMAPSALRLDRGPQL